MKKFILCLIFLIPLSAFAQNPLPQTTEKGVIEIFSQKNHSLIHLKTPEQLQKEFLLKLTPEIFKQLPSEEERMKNSFSENFPGREIMDKLRGTILKSTQTDTLLIDSLYIFTFKSPTDSVLTGKIYATYNAKGNFGNVTRFELDTLNLMWHYTSKEDYFYDDYDRNTSYIHYEWDLEGNDWLPVYRNEMEYDSNGRRTLSAQFNWNNYSKKWIGQIKVEYAWDDWGKQILYAFYHWEETTGGWTGNYKYETAYNEAGRQIFVTYYQWNFSINNWQGNSKTELGYDNIGNIILTIYSVWDEFLGKWIYQQKQESVYGQDGPVEMASYFWDQYDEKWIGQEKQVTFFVNDSEQYSISYSWNNLEDVWEESEKSVSERLNNGLIHHFTTYTKQDSIVPGIIINGFNTEDDINNVWTDLSCPEQTCSVLDSDFVEGTASIRWDYHSSGKINYWGGVCQFQMLNSTDLSGFDCIAMNYKVLEASFASFVFILIESGGEVWDFTHYEVLRDSSGFWKVLTIPFNYMNPRNYVDGIFNPGSIEQVLIQAFSEPGTENSGTILLDNLTTCNIVKSKLWMPQIFIEEVLDENYNLVSSIQSRWDPYLQDFIPIYKYKSDIVYDENGNIISENVCTWDEFMVSDDWRNLSKRKFEYDANGNQTFGEVYFWDEYNNKWIGTLKFESSYDESGNMLTSVSYGWDYWQDKWNPEYREESTFVGDSIQASHATYSYDSYLNKWIGNYKYETVYNDALEAIKTIDYEWDYNTGNWKIINIYWIEHYEYQYDSENRLHAYVHEKWNEILNQWCASEKYYYFWSLHSITEAELVLLNQDEVVLVYPNPAIDAIHIKLNSGSFSGTFSLFDSNGKLLKKSVLTGNLSTLPINDLPKGNYILQIETDNFVESKKIIIQ